MAEEQPFFPSSTTLAERDPHVFVRLIELARTNRCEVLHLSLPESLWPIVREHFPKMRCHTLGAVGGVVRVMMLPCSET